MPETMSRKGLDTAGRAATRREYGVTSMLQFDLGTAPTDIRERLRPVPLDRSVLEPRWIWIALAPVIMAAVTWGPQNYHYTIQVWLRFFSLPVLTIEIGVICSAMALGVRPFLLLRAMPALVQLALGIIAAIAGGTALFVAIDPANAVLRTAVSLIHVCFGLAAAGLVARTSPRFDGGIWPLIVGGLLLYLPMLVLYVMAVRDPLHFDWGHFGLAVSNIRFTGFFAVIGATAAVALACLAGGHERYRWWLLTATLFVGVMFWSGSRNPILAYSAACAIAAMCVPSMRTMHSAVAWVASMAGGALISLIYIPPHPAYGIFRLFSSVGHDDPNVISSGRLAFWIGSLRKFAERPLFGFGESQFIRIVPEAQSVYHHPHNVVFQLLVQWGAVGTVCTLALLAWAWWRMMVMARLSPQQSLPAFLVLTALLVASLFDGIFYFVYPAMMVALTIALGLGPALRQRTIQS